MIPNKILVFLSCFLCALTIQSQQSENILYQQDSVSVTKNFLGVNYWLDTFDAVFSERHFVGLEYEKQTKKGAYIARFNYANRFNMEDYAFEFEAYPKLTDKSYALIEYSFALNKTLFPKHRFGLEYFQIFSKTYEGSIGYKYLDFPTRNISIYTASLGKYYKNYWFNARYFLTESNGSASNSYATIVRRYLKNKYNYVSFNLGYGVYFEEVNLGDVFGESFRVGVNSQIEVFNTIYAKFSVDYRKEETLFSPNNYLNRYTFIIGLKKSF